MERKGYTHSVYWQTIKALERQSLAAFSPSEIERCWRRICSRDSQRRREDKLYSQRTITPDGVYTEYGRILANHQALVAEKDAAQGRWLRNHDIFEEDIAQIVHAFHSLYEDGKELVLKLDPVYRKLRQIQRSKYYEAETRRRRALAAERRKQNRKETQNPMPTPTQIQEAWDLRKESKDNIILLGSLLLDLDCYLKRSFEIDENGVILSRKGGIRQWISLNLPKLEPHYKTLMSYKALAKKLRQVSDLKDPIPVESLLKETPSRPIMQELEALPHTSFHSIIMLLDRHLSPDKVMDDLLGTVALRRKPSNCRNKQTAVVSKKLSAAPNLLPARRRHT